MAVLYLKLELIFGGGWGRVNLSQNIPYIYMEKFPIGKSPEQESPLNGMRLKVTERCPWQCSFCHDEGGRKTQDVKWGPELQNAVNAICEVLPQTKEVHYTGGEPTRNQELAALSTGLASMGLEVKTTTNGQFSEERLREYLQAGLKSFNFSVHSLDPERFLRQQTGRGVDWEEKNKTSGDFLPKAQYPTKSIERLEWAQRQIDQELAMIKKAQELGADVKINTVVSTAADMENAHEIYEWAKSNEIPLRVMNDLGNGLESVNAIRAFISSLTVEEVTRKVTRGASSCSTVYRDADGYEFVFKQIRDMKLESMCAACPRAEDGSCEEQFYGVRLQQGEDGQIYVLLCIQESNEKTQMTVEDFLDSPQLKEIQSHLKD